MEYFRNYKIFDGYLELAVCKDTGFAISKIVNNKKIIKKVLTPGLHS